MSFNKITVFGNLGRDPELTYTPQGTAMCKLSIATTEKRKDAGGEMVEHTTWFRCTAWAKTAELIAEHFKKGDGVYLEGRLRIEEYTTRDGEKRVSCEVNVSGFEFVGTKRDNQQQTERKPQGGRKVNEPDDDDLAF